MKTLFLILSWIAVMLFVTFGVYKVKTLGQHHYEVNRCYQTLEEEDKDPFNPKEPEIIRILDKKEGWVQYRYCTGIWSTWGRLKYSAKDVYYKDWKVEVPCPEGCTQ